MATGNQQIPPGFGMFLSPDPGFPSSPQPLLCPQVFILLLLPLTALSCSSTKSLTDLAEDYQPIIETELVNAKVNIESFLTQHNKTCSDHKPRCSSSKNNLVMTLFNITCRMKTLSLTQTSKVIEYVEQSVGCICTEQSTKRGGRQRKRILCRAKTLLSSLAKCYQLLNSSYGT